MQAAYFNRFAIEIPDEAIEACAHRGDCSVDVEVWAEQITRPDNLTPAVLAAELREYGAWDDEQLADDDANWQRIIWIACGDLQEEARAMEDR